MVIAAAVCKHLGINDGATISNYTDLLLGPHWCKRFAPKNNTSKKAEVCPPGEDCWATEMRAVSVLKDSESFHWIFSSDVTVSWRMSSPGNLVKQQSDLSSLSGRKIFKTPFTRCPWKKMRSPLCLPLGQMPHAKNTQSLEGTDFPGLTQEKETYLTWNPLPELHLPFLCISRPVLPTAHSHLPYTRTLHIMEERWTYHVT